MKKYLEKIIAIIIVVVLLGSMTVFAADPGKSFLNAPLHGERNDFNGQVGYRFEPRSDIKILALGYPKLDIKENHVIRIWNMNTEALIAEVEVTPNSPDSNGFKYELLSEPVILSPGAEYALVTVVYSGQADGWFSSDVSDFNDPLFENDNAVEMLGDAYANNREGYGDMQFYGPMLPGQGYLGANFWYDAESFKAPPAKEAPPVPETLAPAAEADDNNIANENAIETTEANKAIDNSGEENNNNALLIIIAAVVVVVAAAVVVILIVTNSKKKAK